MEELLPTAAQKRPTPSLRQCTRARKPSQVLANSEKRYRALYDEIPSTYFTVDPFGIVLSVNQFGGDHFGYSTHELEGQSALSEFHDYDRAHVKTKLTTSLGQSGKAHKWELRKIHEDGTEFWDKETVCHIRNSCHATVILNVCKAINDHQKSEGALIDICGIKSNKFALIRR